MPSPIKVLIVDDSTFIRYTLSQALNEMSEIKVIGAARDGVEALEMIQQLQPDVVTLDVEMPRLDGISTLRQIMANFPRPVLMLSSLTKEGTVETIQALTYGAVDFIAKPAAQTGIRSVIHEVAAKIIRAAQARVYPLSTRHTTPIAGVRAGSSQAPEGKRYRSLRKNEPIVLIGTSTGGPRALNEVIPALPADLAAAVIVVQHMPAGFTRSLADRLNSLSKLAVKEAGPGDRPAAGLVLLAPGGFHMVLNENVEFTFNQNPPVHGVRPAVDVTLISLVQRYGKAVIASILTGMGSDGTNGSVLLHSLGGHVIAEHEATCVVWGMPRSVMESGASSEILPLPEIAGGIERAVKAYNTNQ
ncbi:MAG: chemotaxis response regulator protein-glutamate methylesterase [Anaerolineaceae bacterium]|nr:chemotaxis response regulator protein-glutamate methylesterase [Anaerolineaceae bacterium]